MKSCVIRGGRLLCAAQNLDSVGDILCLDGRIAAWAPGGNAQFTAAKVIDAQGCWVMPGLVDMHVHLREPGETHKESIASGAAAALAGGVTSLLLMPNTKPVIDSPEWVRWVLAAGEKVPPRIYTSAAATIGQRGESLTAYAALAAAGAVAITDDGQPIGNPRVMRAALAQAHDCRLLLLSHAEDKLLAGEGCVHEGRMATYYGLPGIPASAESVAIARDILLAEELGVRLHVCHVSTWQAVALIRAAKARGVKVSCEVAPHHFSLTDAAVGLWGSNAKMNPPLRTQQDIDALVAGLQDNTIEAIATDHAPHGLVDKQQPLQQAAFGIVGLQTLLPLSLSLYFQQKMALLPLLAKLTCQPAGLLGLAAGSLKVGAPADIVVVDPFQTYTLESAMLCSKSHNTPFLGSAMQALVRDVVIGGDMVWQSQTP